MLAKAGVKFAIYAPTDETIPDLQFIAGYTISQGLSPEEALRAITIVPAEILGIADRVGSIEKGKDADIVIKKGSLQVGKDADIIILDGHPFHYNTFVEFTLINGKVLYDKKQSTYFSHITHDN